MGGGGGKKKEKKANNRGWLFVPKGYLLINR